MKRELTRRAATRPTPGRGRVGRRRLRSGDRRRHGHRCLPPDRVARRSPAAHRSGQHQSDHLRRRQRQHRRRPRRCSAASSAAAAVSPPPAVSSAPVASPTFQIPGPRPSDTKLGPVILVPGFGGDDSMLAVTGRPPASRRTHDSVTCDSQRRDRRPSRSSRSARCESARILESGSAVGRPGRLLRRRHRRRVVRRRASAGRAAHRHPRLAVARHPSGPVRRGRRAGHLSDRMPADGAWYVSTFKPGRRSAGAHRRPWLSMWTTHDEVVVPAESARFDGAVNIALQSVCADDTVDHISLPADPLVAALTLRGLSITTVAVPAASDCGALRAQGA